MYDQEQGVQAQPQAQLVAQQPGNAEVLSAIHVLSQSLDAKVESACKRRRLSDVPTFKGEGRIWSLVEAAILNIDNLDVDAAKVNLTSASAEIKNRRLGRG